MRMSTSQPAVARLEAGDVDTRVSTLERYAAAVGCSLELRLGPPLASDPRREANREP
jgi:predicted transcriptional regulator